MINELLESVVELKQEEKMYVFSIVSKFYIENTLKDSNQQAFVQFLGQYFEIVEPQIDVHYENLDKIDNDLVHKISLFLMYELKYLETESFEFENQDAILDIFDCFSVKKSFIKQIKENILSIDDLNQCYKEFLENKKTRKSVEELLTMVQKYCLPKCNSTQFSSKIKYSSKSEFESMFAFDAKNEVTRYCNQNISKIIDQYVESIKQIITYLSERFSFDYDEWFDDELQEYRNESLNDSKIFLEDLSYEDYVPFSQKADIVDLSRTIFQKVGSEWILEEEKASLYENSVNHKMEDIENKLYLLYQAEITDILEYCSSNYSLIDRDQPFFANIKNFKSLNERISFIDSLGLEKEELLKTLDENFLKYSPMTTGVDTYQMIDYTNGIILFSTSRRTGPMFQQKQEFSVCSLDLMRNMKTVFSTEADDKTGWSVVKSVATDDAIYLTLLFSAGLTDKCTTYFPLKYDVKEGTIGNLTNNGTAIKITEPNNLLLYGSFLYIKNNDLHVGRYNMQGNVEIEYVIEDVMKTTKVREAGDNNQLILQKFLALSDDIYEILKNSDQNNNGFSTYLLGELYDNDTKYGLKDEEKASDLWNKGRKDNIYCRARDMMQNIKSYSKEQIEKIVIDLKNDPIPVLANYLLYLCSKKDICKDFIAIDNYNEFLSNLSTEGNWLAKSSLCLHLQNKMELRRICESLILNGIYSRIDIYLNSFFDNSQISSEEYKLLIKAVQLIAKNVEHYDDYVKVDFSTYTEVKLYSNEKDPLDDGYDSMKTFSTKGAAEDYANKYYERHCEYLRSYFNESSNSYLNKYIKDNQELMDKEIKKIFIRHALNNDQYPNIDVNQIANTVSDSIKKIARNMNISKLYAYNYLKHDFTDMSMEGGLFAKHKWVDFPSTGSLRKDFESIRSDFQQQVKEKMMEILLTLQ